MKKQLIAVAVAAAVATPVMAQNVSLSGRVSLDLQNVNDGTVGSTRQITENTWSSNRLTISVTEDLGGGLKVGFNHETGISTDDGVMTLGDRDSSIYVSGGFGEVKLGRVTHVANDADVFVNAFGGNQGLVGKRWMSRAELAGTSDSQAVSSNNTSIDGLGDKVANSIMYTTPTFSGFQGSLMVGLGEDTTAGEKNNGDLTAAALTYVNGPIKAIAASATQKRRGVAATYGNIEQTSMGAQYDFGMAKVGYVMVSQDRDSKATSDKTEVNLLTVNVPLGNGINAFAAHHSGKVKDLANSGFNAQVFGVSKDLSKRTKTYMTYASTKNDGAASYNVTGQTAATGTTGAATNVGYDPKTLSVGVIHYF